VSEKYQLQYIAHSLQLKDNFLASQRIVHGVEIFS